MRASRPGQSALLLTDVIEILRRENVDYLVIGAFALSVHGIVRASRDADALLQISLSGIKKLQHMFKVAGFHVALRQGDADDPIPMMLVVSDSHGNQVDLLGGLRGLDPKVFSRGIEVPFQGVSLRIVGREDFIAMKCFADGPQDLLDAKDAYLGAEGPVDLDLMRRITRRFGRDAADRLERILTN
jgi:predicted nucleotidyltransferase